VQAVSVLALEEGILIVNFELLVAGIII